MGARYVGNHRQTQAFDRITFYMRCSHIYDFRGRKWNSLPQAAGYLSIYKNLFRGWPPKI